MHSAALANPSRQIGALSSPLSQFEETASDWPLLDQVGNPVRGPVWDPVWPTARGYWGMAYLEWCLFILNQLLVAKIR